MATNRRPRSPKTIYKNETFEEYVTTTLKSQDRMLERLEEKLERPVLNGGFDSLVAKVEKIEAVSEQLREAQSSSGIKIDAIHKAVYDPDEGLYQKVKSNSKWIQHVTIGGKWFAGLLVASLLTGAGKLLYDVISSHIHYAP
jgi:hypothetical protein